MQRIEGVTDGIAEFSLLSPTAYLRSCATITITKAAESSGSFLLSIFTKKSNEVFLLAIAFAAARLAGPFSLSFPWVWLVIARELAKVMELHIT